jgi:hypothetical protein
MAAEGEREEGSKENATWLERGLSRCRVKARASPAASSSTSRAASAIAAGASAMQHKLQIPLPSLLKESDAFEGLVAQFWDAFPKPTLSTPSADFRSSNVRWSEIILVLLHSGGFNR